MTRTRPDVSARLVAAIRLLLAGFAIELESETLACAVWTSITFAGHRLKIRLRLAGREAQPAAAALIARLDSAELDLREHILADIKATAQAPSSDGASATIELEAVTVEGVK